MLKTWLDPHTQLAIGQRAYKVAQNRQLLYKWCHVSHSGGTCCLISRRLNRSGVAVAPNPFPADVGGIELPCCELCEWQIRPAERSFKVTSVPLARDSSALSRDQRVQKTLALAGYSQYLDKTCYLSVTASLLDPRAASSKTTSAFRKTLLRLSGLSALEYRNLCGLRKG